MKWESKIVSFTEVAPDQLLANPLNARRHPARQRDALRASLDRIGWVAPVIVNQRTGMMVDGHARVEEALSAGLMTVPVLTIDVSAEDERVMLATFDPISYLAEYDSGVMAGLLDGMDGLTPELDDLLGGLLSDAKALDSKATSSHADPDSIPGPRDTTITRDGDIWLLPSERGMIHRVMCGDSTDLAQVTQLMDGEQAVLLHSDPPYGMGKEKEGVTNDNLYGPKLDQFQMSWWNTTRKHLSANASAYVWGNPADLWRLWYKGGLQDSEVLTFRNELVWSKPMARGINSSLMRQYPPNTERCLFFMVGAQQMATNMEDYWEGWEPIRSYLADEANSAGFTAADVRRITGAGMFQHWFTKSQWAFIPEQHYEALKEAANGGHSRSSTKS